MLQLLVDTLNRKAQTVSNHILAASINKQREAKQKHYPNKIFTETLIAPRLRLPHISGKALTPKPAAVGSLRWALQRGRSGSVARHPSSPLSELRAQKYTLRVLRSDALRALLGRHCATGCSKSHVRTRPAPQPRAAFNELRSGKLRQQGREPPGPSPDIPNFLPAVPPKRRGALLPEAAVLKRRGSAPSRAEPASPRDAPGTLRPRRAARTPDGGGRPLPIVPAALHHGDILYRLRDSLLSKQPGSESWGCAPSWPLSSPAPYKQRTFFFLFFFSFFFSRGVQRNRLPPPGPPPLPAASPCPAAPRPAAAPTCGDEAQQQHGVRQLPGEVRTLHAAPPSPPRRGCRSHHPARRDARAPREAAEYCRPRRHQRPRLRRPPRAAPRRAAPAPPRRDGRRWGAAPRRGGERGGGAVKRKNPTSPPPPTTRAQPTHPNKKIFKEERRLRGTWGWAQGSGRSKYPPKGGCRAVCVALRAWVDVWAPSGASARPGSRTWPAWC